MHSRLLITILFTVLVSSVLPSEADANCRAGCSVAAKSCISAAKLDGKGCQATCKEVFKLIKPICSAPPENCIDEMETKRNCIENCKFTVVPGEVDACLADATTCLDSCENKPGTCADACGGAPTGSLISCVRPALLTLKSCKNGCGGSATLGSGACLRDTCATNAWNSIDACRTTFDGCMVGCP